MTPAPKSSPPCGMPPITPGSAVSVRWSRMRSSAATAATTSGTPIPRLINAAQRQFESTSARDELALVKRRSRNTVRADTDLAGVGGVVGGSVRLSVRAFRGEYHAVDQYARNHDSPGVKRPARGDPLHLGDNEPVRVSCGHRGRLCIEHERLALHRDVAVGIGRGTANQRHIDRKRLVEKPLLAIDVHHAHEFFGRARVDPSAARAGIDKRPHSHLRQRSRAMRRRVTIEVRDGAQGKVVRLDLVVVASLASFGTSAQWPPIARRTRPLCASLLRPLSRPSPGRRQIRGSDRGDGRFRGSASPAR